MKTFATGALLCLVGLGSASTYIQINDGSNKVFTNGQAPAMMTTSSLDSATYKALSGGVAVQSWSIDLSNEGSPPGSSGGSGGGGGGGKVMAGPLQIQKTVDQWSPALFRYIASGKVLSTLTLATLRTGDGGQSQLQTVYTFSNLVMTGQQWSGSTDPSTSETITFAYGKLTVAVEPYGSDGRPASPAPSSGWDFVANRQA